MVSEHRFQGLGCIGSRVEDSVAQGSRSSEQQLRCGHRRPVAAGELNDTTSRLSVVKSSRSDSFDIETESFGFRLDSVQV